MLFLVVTTPVGGQDELASRSASSWRQRRSREGKLLHFWPRPGRGAAVVLDVESNNELHLLLSEWLNESAASLEIFPLVSEEAFAAGGRKARRRRTQPEPAEEFDEEIYQELEETSPAVEEVQDQLIGEGEDGAAYQRSIF